MPRVSELTRSTSETEISISLDLDGRGVADVSSGLGFLDHMLTSLARHSGIDMTLRAGGDTEVDDHHTVEDCAIVLGRALVEALGERVGIARFGSAYAPLDESLSRAVVDLSGRSWAEIHVPFTMDAVGDVATENLIHFMRSLAIEGRMSLHVDLIRGDNDHHKAEASFKALAMALRAAVAVVGETVPSTKGALG
jgi:imidazoleglycerol phosphate dehydratase HisB